MMADDMAAAGLSAKERLARIEDMLGRMDAKMDARFDSLAARISSIEVHGSIQAQQAERELSNIEKRVWALETNVQPAVQATNEKLAERDKLFATMQQEHDKLADAVSGIKVRVYSAVAALGLIGAAIDILLRIGTAK